VHYPRATPDMWPNIAKLSREAGLNILQTYVFWNIHEPEKGVYDFETGNRNLSLFLTVIQEAGLFVNLRIGPYVCAEWILGGIPMWLKNEPGIIFRTYNEIWLDAMKKFVTDVVRLVEPFLARNGGPIIMLQIENEYGNVQWAYGAQGAKYRDWSADLALSLETDIPWMMCQQDSLTEERVLTTCNGFYCDEWLASHFKSHPTQPGMWTENWPGWFQMWGEPVPHRPVEDVAFAVARFISKGGTFHNYYMWFGGTNFGRSSGGPLIVTSYDYDVALNEYGLPHEPKYSHSAALHNVLNQYSETILSAEQIPKPQSLGHNSEAITYGEWSKEGSVAFLANWDDSVDANVTFRNRTYIIPAWSVTIVDGVSERVAFNTATIPERIKELKPQLTPRPIFSGKDADISWFGETLGLWNGSNPVSANKTLEQFSVTLGKTDYLLYQTPITLSPNDISAGNISLTLSNANDWVHVFIDSSQSLASHEAIDSDTSLSLNISSFQPGVHTLQILTKTIGVVNYGVFLEADKRGLNGKVQIGKTDLRTRTWTHLSGLQGEILHYWSVSGSQKVNWDENWGRHKNQEFSWFRVLFPLIDSSFKSSVFSLDLTGLNKGMVWVNGHNIGRYWLITANGNCDSCDFRGAYNPGKCRTGCGKPSQQFYHVPKSWLHFTDDDSEEKQNLVVILEEFGGDPSKISLNSME